MEDSAEVLSEVYSDRLMKLTVCEVSGLEYSGTASIVCHASYAGRFLSGAKQVPHKSVTPLDFRFVFKSKAGYEQIMLEFFLERKGAFEKQGTFLVDTDHFQREEKDLSLDAMDNTKTKVKLDLSSAPIRDDDDDENASCLEPVDCGLGECLIS